MITRDDFIVKYADDERLRTCNAETVYDGYDLEIRPYLSVISDMIAEGKVSIKQIRMALGISSVLWNACYELFDEFKEVIDSKESIAQLEADLMLVKSVRATEYKNPKSVEMYQHRYNPKYKPKQDKVEVELPKTITIEVQDYSMSDDELEEFEPKI